MVDCAILAGLASAAFRDLEDDVALDLEEEFAAGVDVVVAAGVGPADDHDEEAAVVQADVAHGRLEDRKSVV